MSHPVRGWALWLALTLGWLTVALGLPAGAQARGVGGVVADIPTGGHVGGHRALAHAAALLYGGGPVLHANRTHVIFWAPAGSGLAFPPGYEGLVERFLTDVALDSHRTTNVYGLSGQYADSQGPAAYDSTYGGAVLATDPLPPSDCTEPLTGPGWSLCVTDQDLQLELERTVAADDLPTGGDDIYFIVTPEGLGSCIDGASRSCALGGSLTGYCGYHSQASDGVLYAVIPYNGAPGHCQSDSPRPNQNPADPTISTISHEHNETVTDPDTNAWIDAAGNEEADLCISAFGANLGGAGATAYNELIHGDRYYTQEEWSNENGACEPRSASDPVAILGTAHALAGRAIQLIARASDPHGRILAYNWWLGDGATSRRRALSHGFRRPGSYRVVLRTTDSADNWAYAVLTIRVTSVAAREPHRRPSRAKPRPKAKRRS